MSHLSRNLSILSVRPAEQDASTQHSGAESDSDPASDSGDVGKDEACLERARSPSGSNQHTTSPTGPADPVPTSSRDGKRKRQPSSSPQPDGSPEPDNKHVPVPCVRGKRPRVAGPHSNALPYGIWPSASSDAHDDESDSPSPAKAARARSASAPEHQTLDSPPSSSALILPHTGNAIENFLLPQRPPRSPFNLWQEILKNEDLTRYVATWLPVADLFKVYCISKRFHWVINKKYTSTIMASARNHAPVARRVFPYQAYRRLTIRDPMLHTMPHRPTVARLVPSLKWLQMITYRTLIVDDILLAMAVEGHRFPRLIVKVLMKIWFLLDMPFTGPRIGIIHNPRYWQSCDLFAAAMFFFKLDMRFNDPVAGSGASYMRQMMMAQRSLSTLWLTLRRQILTSRLEVLQMMVKFDYVPQGGNPRNLPIMGVPPSEIGGLSCEAWTAGHMKLLRPDELVMREAIRRKLNLHDYFVEFLLWGYVDWDTGEEISLPDSEGLERKDEKGKGKQTDDAKRIMDQ